MVITKIGSTCVVSSGKNLAALTAGTSYDLGVLPEEYKPSTAVSSMNIISRSGAVGYLGITAATGQITLVPYADLAANEYAYLYMCYPVLA